MELPKRKTELRVTVEPGVIAVLRTLTAKELAKVWEESAPQLVEGQEEAVQMGLRVPLAAMVGLFETHVTGFEGEDAPTFDGEPFKAGDEDHVARLRPTWKITGGSELVTDALMTGAVRGN